MDAWHTDTRDEGTHLHLGPVRFQVTGIEEGGRCDGQPPNARPHRLPQEVAQVRNVVVHLLSNVTGHLAQRNLQYKTLHALHCTPGLHYCTFFSKRQASPAQHTSSFTCSAHVKLHLLSSQGCDLKEEKRWTKPSRTAGECLADCISASLGSFRLAVAAWSCSWPRTTRAARTERPTAEAKVLALQQQPGQ